MEEMRIKLFESFNEDKILQEVDELLVELSDIKFEASRNYMVKDGKNILELWIEREQPDFETDEYFEDVAREYFPDKTRTSY